MKSKFIIAPFVIAFVPFIGTAQGLMKAGKASDHRYIQSTQPSDIPVRVQQGSIEVYSIEKKKWDTADSNSPLVRPFATLTQIQGLHGQDSINRVQELISRVSSDNSGAEPAVSTLNEDHQVRFIGTGGISNIDDISKATGNLAIGLLFRLSNYKRVSNGLFKNWVDPHFLYVMFNTRTGSSSDSDVFLRTFLFPELHKRDFVLGYYWHLEKRNWGIEPLFEGSLNRYQDSAKVHTFRSESFLLGTKFFKKFNVILNSDTISSVVQLFPYYNMITVDPKYNADYALMMSPTQTYQPKPTYHCIGMQALVQVNGVSIFCNMKYVLNKNTDTTPQDLQRFVYTIGSMIML